MRAKIDGFEIPPQALKEIVILNNKIALSGNAFDGEEIASLYLWLNSLKQESKVSYLVENATDRAQGLGTLKYVARAGKADKENASAKFKMSIWL